MSLEVLKQMYPVLAPQIDRAAQLGLSEDDIRADIGQLQREYRQAGATPQQVFQVLTGAAPENPPAPSPLEEATKAFTRGLTFEFAGGEPNIDPYASLPSLIAQQVLPQLAGSAITGTALYKLLGGLGLRALGTALSGGAPGLVGGALREIPVAAGTGGAIAGLESIARKEPLERTLANIVQGASVGGLTGMVGGGIGGALAERARLRDLMDIQRAQLRQEAALHRAQVNAEAAAARAGAGGAAAPGGQVTPTEPFMTLDDILAGSQGTAAAGGQAPPAGPAPLTPEGVAADLARSSQPASSVLAEAAAKAQEAVAQAGKTTARAKGARARRGRAPAPQAKPLEGAAQPPEEVVRLAEDFNKANSGVEVDRVLENLAVRAAAKPVEPPPPPPPPEAPVKPLENFQARAQAAFDQLNVQGARDIVRLDRLREAMGNPPDFDKQMLRLHARGVVNLMTHDHPASLQPEERAGLIQNPRKSEPPLGYVTWRSPRRPPAPVPEPTAPAAAPAPKAPEAPPLGAQVLQEFQEAGVPPARPVGESAPRPVWFVTPEDALKPPLARVVDEGTPARPVPDKPLAGGGKQAGTIVYRKVEVPNSDLVIERFGSTPDHPTVQARVDELAQGGLEPFRVWGRGTKQVKDYVSAGKLQPEEAAAIMENLKTHRQRTLVVYRRPQNEVAVRARETQELLSPQGLAEVAQRLEPPPETPPPPKATPAEWAQWFAGASEPIKDPKVVQTIVDVAAATSPTELAQAVRGKLSNPAVRAAFERARRVMKDSTIKVIKGVPHLCSE